MTSGYVFDGHLGELVEALCPPVGAPADAGFGATALLLCCRATQRVLDAGCGRAKLRAPIQTLGHAYIGLDLACSAADVIGDIASLPFSSAAFELVLCRSVLQYSLQPLAALRELHRVLTPKGRLLCEVPFLEPWVWGSKLHYSPAGIALLAREAGFRVNNLWEGWSVAEAVAEAESQMNVRPRSQVDERRPAIPLAFAVSLLLLCSRAEPDGDSCGASRS